MKPRIQTGRGISGALRYVKGQGRDPKTGRFKTLEPGEESRAELLGGTGFGFDIVTEADAELARKMMEYAALNQGSKTRKCEQDCLHLTLSWERGEKPTNDEKMAAARSALAAQGMGNAMALVYSHNDEDYEHVHIVASKINPETAPRLRSRRQLAQGCRYGPSNTSASMAASSTSTGSRRTNCARRLPTATSTAFSRR